MQRFIDAETSYRQKTQQTVIGERLQLELSGHFSGRLQ
jgi:hypothetical protein